ncbi:MAG TPA: TonB-dependent siderophore receptor [Caulobacterales bacterium]|nr:TonB-dependent siderophore receptor [Caulobacterales bacterium]
MGGAKRPRSLRAEQAASGLLVGMLGLICAAPSAFADDMDVDQTDTVIVTGHRPDANPYADPQAPYKVDRSASSLFTEPLLNTPKSVTVLSDSLIQDMGVSSFRDIFRAQPGVTLGTGEGGNAFGDRIFIRGFDARNDVYIDGVRDPGVGTRETFATQQVEILRGPSSTFGGRGTTGGAVSLVSKAPNEGNWGDVDVTVGTDNLYRATIDANRQLGDKFAVRVNAMVHRQQTPGRDEVFSNRWGAALAAVYHPTQNIDLGFDYFHLTTDGLPDWGVPYDTAHNRPFQVDRENYYGILSRDFIDTFSDVYTAKLDWRFSDNARLHSITRYGQSGNAYTASAPETPNNTTVVPGFPPGTWTVSANAKRRDAVTDYWVNQTNLTLEFDTGAIAHTLVSGVEWSHEETLNRTRAFTECATLPCSGLASNPRLDLYNPDAHTPWPSGSAITGRPVITTDTAAAYLLDTLHFSPHWEAFGGLRYDDYEAQTTGLPPDRDTHSRFWNWHGGLVFKPVDYTSFYLSYGSSSNPPCEQLDAFALDYGGCDVRVVALDPVRNTSWELGAKANIQHLNLTAAIFSIERSGAPISVGSGSTATIGVQDQEVVGLELGAAGNVTERWSIFGGLSLMDTEVTKSDIAGQAGSRLPNVSESSFTLTSRYEFTDRFSFGATAVYNSQKFGGTTVAGTTRVPGYWRYDLFGEFEVRDGVELKFNVLNLTDEVYYDALYRSATPFVYIAPGRSASITLDVDF